MGAMITIASCTWEKTAASLVTGSITVEEWVPIAESQLCLLGIALI